MICTKLIIKLYFLKMKINKRLMLFKDLLQNIRNLKKNKPLFVTLAHFKEKIWIYLI